MTWFRMSTESRSNVSRLSSLALALGIVGAAVLQGAAISEAGMGPVLTVGDTVFTLHGNTPSMAWSPDSSRLVVNSGYTYYGWEQQVTEHEAELGVWVVDPARSSFVKVSRQPGYHPLWLGNDQVAWGHSRYEHGDAGLYTSPADRRAVTRIGLFDGVNHTLPAKEGGILFFSGWPEDMGWSVVDPATGDPKVVSRPRGTSKDDHRSSWKRPKGLYVDQCAPSSSQVRVNFEGRWRVYEEGEEPRTLKGQPYVFDYDGGSPKLPAPESVVWPCVSPDGQWVAWVSKGAQKGDLVLQIERL